ncbi:hypothetical protein MTX78_05925 [Hymenobacter tibetensis]|uniref:Uncharacterized protein n=1 Tax=Hymenobacter tibetensis TaxID=497967 RepID=A0ABY4D1B8_9BACT|nr:hypothetical protein [Hymenobacter tibetensis]UOG76132.1 hypothetical protein MTX78_05925 [Hymenobacter tibetensis]
MEQSLSHLKDVPPASNAPVLTWAQVVAGEEGASLRYPVQSGPPTRGVYRSFEEFRQNTPTLAEGPFEIRRKPRKGAQWAGTEDVEAWYLELDAYNPRRLVRGGAWGVSDGETAYVFYRGHYFPLQPAGNNYTFTGFKAHDPSAMAAGAILGGLAGAALVAATSTNEPQLYKLRMTSGRVVSSMKQAVSANGFAAPDTAAIYLYRRQDAAPTQPLVVTLGGREVGTLAPNSFLALSWRDRRQAMELCVRGGQPQCQSFVPDFTTATYFECSVPKGGGPTPAVVKTSPKEGTFYVHRFRVR